MIDFKLADIKLESSVAYLPKLEKNAVWNIWRYLKRFYTRKQIYRIFLKFDHSLSGMPKIMEIAA